MLSVFGSKAIEFSGAGALGVLTMATVAAYRWGTQEKVITVIIDRQTDGRTDGQTDIFYILLKGRKSGWKRWLCGKPSSSLMD